MFEDRTVVGLVEEIMILDHTPLNLKARIDTGATRSSIDENIAKKLNTKEAGSTTVKSSHGTTKRKLVKLTIILGGKRVAGLFTLFDRNHMTYPALIGQNILKQGFVIDPQKE